MTTEMHKPWNSLIVADFRALYVLGFMVYILQYFVLIMIFLMELIVYFSHFLDHGSYRIVQVSLKKLVSVASYMILKKNCQFSPSCAVCKFAHTPLKKILFNTCAKDDSTLMLESILSHLHQKLLFVL